MRIQGMKKCFLNSGLKTKIILAFCVLLAVNMLLTSAAFYLYANKSAAEKFQKNSQDILRQINLHLDEKFTGLAQKVNAISSNLSFVTPMNEFLQDDTARTNPVLAGDIANMIYEIKASDDFVDSVYIYTPKCIFDDYFLTRKPGMVFEDTPMYRYFVYKPWESAAWFPVMENPLYESGDMVIPVVYRQKIGGETVCFVINISREALAEYLEGAYESFEHIFVVDAEGGDILGGGSELEEAVLDGMGALQVGKSQEVYGKITSRGAGYYVAAASMNVNKWNVYALTAAATVMKDMKSIRFFLILVNSITSVGCLVVILWISGLLTGSLKELAGVMEQAEDKHYGVHFDYPYGDEVGRLGRNFNQMLDAIQEHIRALEREKEQVKEVQKQRRRAELLALQAQINPHFLYNTLNVITWQAVAQGADEISLISNALGKYFRISLSRGKEIITVQEEAEHVKSYLEIQKIRYKSKLNYKIDILPELEPCETVKLVLQPLVENALYHGIKVKDGQGTVWISGRRQGGCLELAVEDDGGGIPAEKLELLNRRLQDGEVDSETGYGIYNVNNRLKLYYGSDYGLKLLARESGGIRAVLTLPAGSGERMGDYV